MSRSKAIAVLFYLGAVVIGAAAGIAVDRKLVRDRLDDIATNQKSMQDRFFADLGLTPTQRAQWDSLGREARKADSVLTAPVWLAAAPLRPQLDSIRNARDAKRRALLTPEQQAFLDKRQQDRGRINNGRR
jgi:Spy/CpxP family protein refolding chaperone